jgi:hypothetical protein
MTELLTAKQLGDKYGVSQQSVNKMMGRHGYQRDKQKRYKESEYLKAKAAGAQLDKRGLAAQLADAEHAGESLQAQKLRRQIQLLDVDIQMAEAKLAEMTNRVIEVEKHKEHCEAIARLMLTWWDQAAENAATKVKDAEVLNELRRAGERARQEILDFA